VSICLTGGQKGQLIWLLWPTVAQLVLMDNEHSQMLGLASQMCSVALKGKMNGPGCDIVGWTLPVKKHH